MNDRRLSIPLVRERTYMKVAQDITLAERKKIHEVEEVDKNGVFHTLATCFIEELKVMAWPEQGGLFRMVQDGGGRPAVHHPALVQ